MSMMKRKNRIRKTGALQIGEYVEREPVSFPAPFVAGSTNQREMMVGRVCYIHPLGRFHVVEFQGRSGSVREAFLGVER